MYVCVHICYQHAILCNYHVWTIFVALINQNLLFWPPVGQFSFSPARATGPGWTVIGNSVCVCVCLSVTGSRAVHRQDRAKSILYRLKRLGPTMLTSENETCRPSWIFEKKAKNLFFSCISASRPPRRLIFCEGDPLIRCWELNFHFKPKKRKMTYPVTQIRLG